MKALIVFGGLWCCIAVLVACGWWLARDAIGRRDEWAAARRHSAEMHALAPRRRG
jgi:hypothetical protein